MIKNLLLCCFIGGALFVAPQTLAAPTAKGAVEVLNQGIVKTKNNSRVLFQAIQKAFDLPTIAVHSIGKRRWKQWNKKERAQYLDVFAKYITAIYLNRFQNYIGTGLDIYNVQQKGARALVYTRIQVELQEGTLQRNETRKIDFSVYKKGKNWLINDVYFKGTISEVAGFRSQLVPVVKEQGYKGLIAEMKKKCKSLKKFCYL